MSCVRRLLSGLAAGSVLLLTGVAPLTHAQGQRQPDEEARDETRAPQVDELRFQGVKALDEDELEEAIATRASGCRSLVYQIFCPYWKSPYFYERRYLDRTELARDILRLRVLYYKRGWRQAQVDTVVSQKEPGRAVVTFRVTEGEPLRLDSVVVRRADGTPPPDNVRRAARLRAGDPLDLFRVDTTLLRIRERLWDEGFADAVVDTAVAIDSARRRATLTYSIDRRQRAVVGDITVRGNEEVETRTILRSLGLDSGDVFRRTGVLEGQRKLYQSGLFRRATIAIAQTADSVKPLEITVREAPPRDALIRAGFSTVDFGQAEARLTWLNWLGGARRLVARSAIGNLGAPTLNARFPFARVVPDGLEDRASFVRPTYEASLAFEQPWLFDTRNTFAASTFLRRRTAPGVFVDRGFGGSATLTREIALRTPISLDYRYELSRIEASGSYFCINFGVCDLATISTLRAQTRLSPIAFVARTDRTDEPLMPRSGWTARGEVEHAANWTLSDFRYDRGLAELTGYRPIRWGVIAARLHGGRVLNFSRGADLGLFTPTDLYLLHPRKRFYAGGSRSVRGYGENQLGPRVLTIPASLLREQGCDVTVIAKLVACGAVNDPKLEDAAFSPRPIGGTSVVEGSVEWRIPLLPPAIQGAVFLDGALVGEATLGNLTEGTGALTPGLGVRYLSPAGPIRLDLGYRPPVKEELPVFTQVTIEGRNEIVPLQQRRAYDPVGSATGIQKVLRSFTIHLSIGEAF